MLTLIRYGIFIVLLSIGPASAQEEADAAIVTASDTRIEVDDNADEIRFLIKGKVIAVLREDGLHVRDNINYGGELTDYGHQSFEERTNKNDGMINE